MISDDEAKSIIKKLRKFKNKALKSKTKQDKNIFKEYEKYCLNCLDYLVLNKASKYRGFSNYEDLLQDGREALLKAIDTFNCKKGSFFFWANLFVNTKLSRSANNHTVIRYPMHFAKNNRPHKENFIPVLQDNKASPENSCEISEINNMVNLAMSDLKSKEKNLIKMIYGFNGDSPMSINKICQQLKISRSACLKIIEDAFSVLKDKIDF